MGEFREYRCTIPGALMLLVFGLTLCISPDIRDKALEMLSGSNNLQGPVALLLGLIVTSLALGYLFGLLTNIVFGTPGIPYGGILPLPLNKDTMRDQLYEQIKNVEGLKHLTTARELNTECMLRFHSHAPAQVLNFSTRRLTAVYVALNSIWALGFGSLFVLLILFVDGIRNNWCFVLALLAIVLLGAWLLCMVLLCMLLAWDAHIAAKEQWEVFCKFIEWDVKTNPSQARQL
jgi:hypothetical protein